MTTLGIYGDSFADDRSSWDRPRLTTTAWSYRLAMTYDSYENYALQGTSLFYSYQKFIATQHKWDKIVFIVTNPGRWPGTINVAGRQQFLTIHNFDRAQNVLKSYRDFYPTLTADQLRDIDAIGDWFMHRDDGFEFRMHDLMISKIKNLRPDALLIHIDRQHKTQPVSMNDFRMITFQTLVPSLFKASNNLLRNWQMMDDRFQERDEHNICHFTTEINDLFFTVIQQSLETGVWDPIIPKTWPHQHGISHYYRSI